MNKNNLKPAHVHSVIELSLIKKVLKLKGFIVSAKVENGQLIINHIVSPQDNTSKKKR